MESKKEREGCQLCIEDPYIQDEVYDCGWATVANILLMSGRDTPELLDDVRQRLEMTYEDGTLIRKLREVLDYLELKHNEREEATVDDLEREIDALKPCIVLYQAWEPKPEKMELKAGHYSLVVGYNEKYLWVIDPSQWYDNHFMMDGLRRIDKRVFDRWWIDIDGEGKVYDHWYSAVTLG